MTGAKESPRFSPAVEEGHVLQKEIRGTGGRSHEMAEVVAVYLDLFTLNLSYRNVFHSGRSAAEDSLIAVDDCTLRGINYTVYISVCICYVWQRGYRRNCPPAIASKGGVRRRHHNEPGGIRPGYRVRIYRELSHGALVPVHSQTVVSSIGRVHDHVEREAVIYSRDCLCASSEIDYREMLEVTIADGVTPGRKIIGNLRVRTTEGLNIVVRAAYELAPESLFGPGNSLSKA